MQFDRHGNRIWRDARALLDDEHARYAVGSVAVPYGTCTEPSNVAAGGSDCPVRFRCAGCDHFRTDVSYLPDLTAYLDDLLRTRERLAAAAGIDTWARDQAAPADQEITVIRQLISRIKGDISGLTRPTGPASTRPSPSSASTAPVSLGMPRLRPAAHPSPPKRRPGLMTSRKPAGDTVAGARTETMSKGRQADSARRRQRVLTALDRATASGDRDQRVRHRPRTSF